MAGTVTNVADDIAGKETKVFVNVGAVRDGMYFTPAQMAPTTDLKPKPKPEMRSWSSINVLCTEPGLATKTDPTTPAQASGFVV